MQEQMKTHQTIQQLDRMVTLYGTKEFRIRYHPFRMKIGEELCKLMSQNSKKAMKIAKTANTKKAMQSSKKAMKIGKTGKTSKKAMQRSLKAMKSFKKA